jgi:putative ABC transport system permease protein
MAPELLQTLNKRVGERFGVTGLGRYKGIDLQFEVVGQLPAGTYDAGILRWDYLNDALDNYPKGHGGLKHPLEGKRLNLVVLKVPDRAAFRRVAGQVQSCPLLTDPPLECQTAAAAVAARLRTHHDLLWAMRWLLLPAVVVTMALVVVNATAIAVRERYGEMALLKVLGFRPGQILLLVLGEAVLVGGVSGLVGAGLVYGMASSFFRGAEFLFVEEFLVPAQALWWGPALGAGTALLGGIAPAWSAGAVKVAEVFARVV